MLADVASDEEDSDNEDDGEAGAPTSRPTFRDELEKELAADNDTRTTVIVDALAKLEDRMKALEKQGANNHKVCL